jgi:hypothetical protein
VPAGLTVTLDTRDVTPPMILVGLPLVTGRTGPCAHAVSIDVIAAGQIDRIAAAATTPATTSRSGRPTTTASAA